MGAAIAGGVAWGPAGAIAASGFALITTVSLAIAGTPTRTQVEATELECEEARRRAAKAAQLSRTKSRFLASMSHEIRTPMNGILGMGDVLMRSELTHEQRDCVETLQRSAQGLMLILNDILDFSKIEAGTLELDHAPIRPVEILESVAELHYRTAFDKGIEFAYYLDPAVPATIPGDALRLRQVLTNFVTNAIKFTTSGSVVVEMRLTEAAGTPHLHVAVIDTGIGIPADARGRLFQPFSQASVSTAQKYGGTGLGLAISSELVALMGGRLDVDSVHGEGSTFWFEVPLAVDLGPPLDSPDGSGVRVLLFDDEPVRIDVMRRTLEAWGHDVTVASELEAACQMLVAAVDANRPFALGLVDLDVASGQGREFANRVKSSQALRGMKLIALNVMGRTLQPGSLARSGFDAWISKPVSPVKLSSALVYVADECSERTLVEGDDERQTEVEEITPDDTVLDVLLVEDNVVNQRVATFMLQREGCRVDVAANGELALEAFERCSYDLIFMDCHMPVMDGFRATRAIRARDDGGSVPIIAMTALVMSGDRQRCLAEGMNDYLPKPVQTDELQRVLRQWGERGALHEGVLPRITMNEKEEQGVLDMDVVASLKELGGADDPELFQELVELFLADTPMRLDALLTAVQAGDIKGMEAAAHALKSSAANLGALRLSDLFRSIETAGRSNSLESAKPFVDRCQGEYEEAKSALEREL
ncbi:MAG: response regulator [Planctomycetota bacterium]